MSHSQISLKMASGETIYGNRWTLDDDEKVIANVVLVHGMAEHSMRYDEFAKYLNSIGINVYAVDQPGHGLNVTVPETPEYGLGVWPDNGFKLATSYIYELVSQVRLSMKPTILVGHSLGSFVSQRYYQRFNATIDGLVLCGSNANCFTFNASRRVAKIMKVFIKKDHRERPSKFFDRMQTLAYNKAPQFPDHYKTNNRWLSANEENVKAYDNDPLCGFTCSFNFYFNLFNGLKPTFQKNRVKEILHPVKILLVAGTKDPVGRNGKGVKKLEKFYKSAGQDVRTILYEGMRHEILNETEKQKVYEDIGAFIKEAVEATVKHENEAQHKVSND